MLNITVVKPMPRASAVRPAANTPGPQRADAVAHIPPDRPGAPHGAACPRPMRTSHAARQLFESVVAQLGQETLPRLPHADRGDQILELSLEMLRDLLDQRALVLRIEIDAGDSRTHVGAPVELMIGAASRVGHVEVRYM